MNVKEHYDTHLGNFYAWMTGDFQEKQAIQEAFLKKSHVLPFSTNVALDLGCGHGLQAVSLAKLGFHVAAVDFNRQLLKELEQNTGSLNITCYEEDLILFLQNYKSSCDAITCMGDTLTHLPTVVAVQEFISNSYQKLTARGKLVLSFRDLTHELTGSDRFIPVKSDADRIHICFLEYFPDHVKVYDILHTYSDHLWQQKVSWYPKLRLNAAMVKEFLRGVRFTVVAEQEINRMTYLVAVK